MSSNNAKTMTRKPSRLHIDFSKVSKPQTDQEPMLIDITNTSQSECRKRRTDEQSTDGSCKITKVDLPTLENYPQITITPLPRVHSIQNKGNDEPYPLKKLAPKEAEKSYRLILATDNVVHKTIVEVPLPLAATLADLQRESQIFLWERCCGSIDNCINQIFKAAYVAHSCGLGKTRTSCTYVVTLMTNPKLNISRVVIVCPTTTITNFYTELKECIRLARHHFQSAPHVVTTADFESDKKTGPLTLCLTIPNSILLISSAAFGSIPKTPDECKSDYDILMYLLVFQPGPHLIIFDEAHMMTNNEKTKLFNSCSTVATNHQIYMTGTPLQNSPIECMTIANLIEPNSFPCREDFVKTFALPILRGSRIDSDDEEKKAKEAACKALNEVTEPYIHRRGIEFLMLALNNISYVEIELKVALTEPQFKILDSLHRIYKKSLRAEALNLYHKTIEVCGHPTAAISRISERGTDETTKSLLNKWIDDNQLYIDKKPLLDDSNKLIITFDIIQEADEVNDKIVLCSNSLTVLDTVEKILKQEHNKFTKKEGWVLGCDYYRFDGHVKSSLDREKMAAAFNDSSNRRGRLFLITAKAGGIGLNMFGANRLILLDASFNPAVATQNGARIFRMGQLKPTYVYRIIVQGSLEEVMTNMQLSKKHISESMLHDESTFKSIPDSVPCDVVRKFTPTRSEASVLDITEVTAVDTLLGEVLKETRASVTYAKVVTNSKEILSRLTVDQ